MNSDSFWTVQNTQLVNNTNHAVGITAVSMDQCNHTITNVTAGTGLPLVYYGNLDGITFENNDIKSSLHL